MNIASFWTNTFGDTPEGREQARLYWWLNGLFILGNAILLFNNLYWFIALPAVLLVILLAIRRMEILVMAVTLLTPFSYQINDIGMGFGLSIPSEPLMMLMLLVFAINVLRMGGYDRSVLSHPLSILVLLHLGWMGFTCITSTMPLVSFKFFVSQLWFISVFYLFLIPVFKKISAIKTFIWLYALSLSGVMIYTIYQHYLTGFNDKAAHWVMSPFYNDHTAYAAVIAMYIPVLINFIFDKEQNSISRTIAGMMAGLCILAFTLSYTRAAWISILASLMIFIAFLLKIKFRTIFIGIASILLLFFSFKTEIFLKLERNRQDSSKDFSRHIKSISNISTDASNLERINRWHSAWRMFLVHPFVGFGPGTYQFQYAPFQHSSEKTIISTNSGIKGTAHSEYLLKLSEEGFPGMLFLILIVLSLSYYAIRLYSYSTDRQVQYIALSVFLGLVTYLIHAFMNNFLDTDKASVPFWGFVAILIALDLRNRNQVKKESEQAIN